MKNNLKILSVIGGVLTFIALLGSDTPYEYLFETCAFIGLFFHSWGLIKARMIMLWVSGILCVWYLFGIYAIFDFILWIFAFMFLYKDKK